AEPRRPPSDPLVLCRFLPPRNLPGSVRCRAHALPPAHFPAMAEGSKDRGGSRKIAAGRPLPGPPGRPLGGALTNLGLGRYGGLSSRVLLDAEAFPNVWVVGKGGHITAGFGADGISRIAHGASRRSRSAVALKSKAFRIIRARGSRVRSGLAAGGRWI